MAPKFGKARKSHGKQALHRSAGGALHTSTDFGFRRSSGLREGCGLAARRSSLTFEASKEPSKKVALSRRLTA